MATGRYFRALTSYDLLGNLLPGVFALTLLASLLPNPPYPTKTPGILFFSLVGYAFGQFIQAHSAMAMGDSFEATLDSVREFPRQIESDDSSLNTQVSNDQDADYETGLLDRFVLWIYNYDWNHVKSAIRDRVRNIVVWSDRIGVVDIISALSYPIYCFIRDPSGRVLENEQAAFEVFKDLVTRYDIDRGTSDYERLINIISSEIEDIAAPARSTRFQAIRNFHRAMWITCWYVFVLTTSLVLIENYPQLQKYTELIGISYATPGLFSYWGPDWHFVVLFGVLTIGFHTLAYNFEVQFTEYLFSDYQVFGETESETEGWKRGSEVSNDE